MHESEQSLVAIAGATGFVGRALLERWSGKMRLRGLTRSVARAEAGTRAGLRVAWQGCDLFSVLDVEMALRGADAAVYLVHSMMPSARLTQGSFRDLDLLLADNFARGAANAGVKHILYLGGLLPASGQLSEHLESRREVEEVLAAHGVPVTILRAGLIIGERGSSFRILERLVRRLPVMLCPSWTRTPTQPIALDDVLALLDFALVDDRARGGTWDVGGPDVVSYLEMIQRTAVRMGRAPVFVPVPFVTPGLSRLWVSAITGVDLELVGPLVESLKVPMVARNRALQNMAGVPGLELDVALSRALHPGPLRHALHRLAEVPVPRRELALLDVKPSNLVCSVQRLPRPATLDASGVALAYTQWLPAALSPFLSVVVEDDGHVVFQMRGTGWPLLELHRSPERSSNGRSVLYVTGGWLADVRHTLRGRLEFRVLDEPHCVLAAIHDFRPSLPWWIYTQTHARVHLWVMQRFARHLRRRASVKALESDNRQQG